MLLEIFYRRRLSSIFGGYLRKKDHISQVNKTPFPLLALKFNRQAKVLNHSYAQLK